MVHYYRNPNAHPMSGLFDSIKDAFNTEVNKLTQKVTSGQVAQDLIASAAGGLLQNLALDPIVQQKTREEAERAALEKTVSTLQQQRQELTAALEKALTSPAQFVKESPAKAAMIYGGGALAAFFIFKAITGKK